MTIPMRPLGTLTLLAAAAVFVTGPSVAAGPLNLAAKTAISGDAETTKEVVQYRLDRWKTAHAGSKEQAQKMIATLKKLQCEVKTHIHGDHIDITYRCADWKSMTLPDHKTAHQWESWLKKYGFQTKHVH